MWAIFIKGGPVMFPLALLSILGVGVVIEKLFSLRNKKVLTQEIIHCIEALRSPSDIPMAIRTCDRHKSPLANILRAGLEEADSPVADVRMVMEDTGRREVKRLERYLVVLETVAAASPLLGLLGTVFGMIRVFSVISIAGVGEAGLLSGGIAEALITTAFGLSIGIPALVAFNFFDSRVENFVIKIEGYVHVLLKQLSAMKSGEMANVRGISDAT
ncbi:MAG: MotA/TolQ/ExbB proton channel family protein [Candidatus Krumholzibacteria bacterium]|nr:MotA/TolQ/ExbB proton channel family protein [Candidatus Krumholzibacteria bacterium]